MEHMGFVMTKDSLRRRQRSCPPNSEELKESYDIFDGGENTIPHDLIVRWDQRGMRMVPVNDWTLGDKRDTFSAINVYF